MARKKWILVMVIHFISVINSASGTEEWNESEFVCGWNLCSGTNFKHMGYNPTKELNALLRRCVNGRCACPPDTMLMDGAIWWSDNRVNLCIPKLIDTGKPCSAETGCDPFTEKCSSNNSNNTCLQCQIGRLSPSTGECSEGPFHGDICRRGVELAKVRLGNATYEKQCIGEKVDCDSTTHKCSCREFDYYDKDRMACVQMPRLGGDCSHSKVCRDDPYSYGYAKCSENGTCVCKATNSRRSRQFCAQLVRGKCLNPFDCVDDAKCERGKCACYGGHVANSKGYCLQFIYGRNCTAEPNEKVLQSMDEQRLTCINGQYRCEVPTERYYDGGPDPEQNWYLPGNRHLCLTTVGGTCDSANDTRCTEGASCVNVKGKFKCRCNQGYSSTPENKCLKHVEYGESCDGTRKCNNYAGIACLKGTCQCLNRGMRYDSNSKRCLNSVKSGFCGKLDLPSSKSIQILCEPPLKCSRPDGPRLSGSKCL